MGSEYRLPKRFVMQMPNNVVEIFFSQCLVKEVREHLPFIRNYVFSVACVRPVALLYNHILINCLIELWIEYAREF